MTDYKSMFEQAVRTLAAIDEALGIGDDGCGDPEQTLDAIANLKASSISQEVIDILHAENEKLASQVSELAVFTSRLSRQLKKAAPDNELHGQDQADEKFDVQSGMSLLSTLLKRTGMFNYYSAIYGKLPDPKSPRNKS